MNHEFLNRIPTLDSILVEVMLALPSTESEYRLVRNDYYDRIELRYFSRESREFNRLVTWLRYDAIKIGGVVAFKLWAQRTNYLEEINPDRWVST